MHYYVRYDLKGENPGTKTVRKTCNCAKRLGTYRWMIGSQGTCVFGGVMSAADLIGINSERRSPALELAERVC